MLVYVYVGLHKYGTIFQHVAMKSALTSSVVDRGSNYGIGIWWCSNNRSSLWL